MLLPRVFAPARAACQFASTPLLPSTRVLDAFRAANTSPALSFLRHASHQAQGRANGAKQGPGKRLGAKKSGGEYVVTGNIIFRQRGTAWYPGENCKMGRDHCIFSMANGYVRYYRDPRKHPDRQYIGVVFDKEMKLPTPPHAATRRKLNMLPVKRDIAAEAAITGEITLGEDGTPNAPEPTKLKNAKGYATRKTNYEIGRAGAEMEATVKKFVPGDRWTAWRKSSARISANVENRKLRNAQKSAKPKRKERAR